MSYLVLNFLSMGCGGGPGFSDTPEISFIGISKDTMYQSEIQPDSLFLTFSFRDGDGDLGSRPMDSNRNIILTDSRTNERYRSYRVPPLDIEGAQSGIEGEITIKVSTDCCVYPPETNIDACEIDEDYPMNDLILAVKLIDDSGKESNSISTPVITLLCI